MDLIDVKIKRDEIIFSIKESEKGFTYREETEIDYLPWTRAIYAFKVYYNEHRKEPYVMESLEDNSCIWKGRPLSKLWSEEGNESITETIEQVVEDGPREIKKQLFPLFSTHLKMKRSREEHGFMWHHLL